MTIKQKHHRLLWKDVLLEQLYEVETAVKEWLSE
jgi:hypothetical protein